MESVNIPRRSAVRHLAVGLLVLGGCAGGPSPRDADTLRVDDFEIPTNGGLTVKRERPYLAGPLVESAFGAAVKHVPAAKLAVVCRDTICVPIPMDEEERAVLDGRVVCVSARALADALSYDLFWNPESRSLAFDSRRRDAGLSPAPFSPVEHAEQATRLVLGTLAPDFTLPLTDGSRMTLSSLRGRRVLVNCWASW